MDVASQARSISEAQGQPRTKMLCIEKNQLFHSIEARMSSYKNLCKTHGTLGCTNFDPMVII